MPEHSDSPDDREALREKIIGLGGRSVRKSYYPQLQKQLTELERFRALLDQSRDAILLAQVPSGRLIDVNESACRQLGYARQELLRLAVQDFVAPVAWGRIRAMFAEEQGIGTEGETITTQLYKRAGDIVPVEMTVRPVVFDDEVYAVVVARDITERVAAEEARRESEQMLARIIELLPDATVVVSGEGKVIAWNRAMETLTGFRAEDMLGKGDYEYAIPFYGERRPILVDLVLEPRQEIEEERYIVIKRQGDVLLGEAFVSFGGKEHYLAGTAAPLYDLKGHITGAIEIIRDITARKRAEAEREALIAELEAKNTELERFTYSVSHDLKSPLLTIKGFLGFLERDAQGGDLERVEADVARISGAADKMQQLLDELLELSRIGRVMNPPQPVHLGELAREVMEMLVGRLEERGVVVEIAPDLPVVSGDPVRLRQVLQNLVDNAVKFMGDQPEPHVEIGMRRASEEAIFYVRDNGVGIEPRYQEQVFGLFEKLDSETEGTGLGLAIVKRIVEVHGGRIWVESEGVGKGSTFCFTLGKGQGA